MGGYRRYADSSDDSDDDLGASYFWRDPSTGRHYDSMATIPVWPTTRRLEAVTFKMEPLPAIPDEIPANVKAICDNKDGAGNIVFEEDDIPETYRQSTEQNGETQASSDSFHCVHNIDEFAFRKWDRLSKGHTMFVATSIAVPGMVPQAR